mmetsp:Transcript_6104/g.23737  ORF Transcript_6104/g.23737 Transcript_6104/m.23737 type:complete len:219 (-) Transcript_6104:505-1161(-)
MELPSRDALGAADHFCFAPAAAPKASSSSSAMSDSRSGASSSDGSSGMAVESPDAEAAADGWPFVRSLIASACRCSSSSSGPSSPWEASPKVDVACSGESWPTGPSPLVDPSLLGASLRGAFLLGSSLLAPSLLGTGTFASTVRSFLGALCDDCTAFLCRFRERVDLAEAGGASDGELWGPFAAVVAAASELILSFSAFRTTRPAQLAIFEAVSMALR